MKKVIAALLSFILAAVFSGCTGGDISSGFSLLSPENKEKTFTVEDYGLTFRTPTGWVEDMEDTELDYFVTNISAGLGIFGFYRSDFYELQILFYNLSMMKRANALTFAPCLVKVCLWR